MRSLMALYNIRRFSTMLTYMLQNVEYEPQPYLRWFWRTDDYSRVMYRRQLDSTRAARALRYTLIFGMTLQIVAGLVVLVAYMRNGFLDFGLLGVALLFSYPVIWAHLIVLPLVVARVAIIMPKQRQLVENAKRILAEHPGVKIAVAGSYGKTSMKELLVAIIGESKKVAATPANKNVTISQARFAQSLQGDEDILIFEYGEGRPGDVKRFAELTHPAYGVITGLAAAHLDQYKTIEAAGADIFSLADYLGEQHVYVNGESESAEAFLKGPYIVYSRQGMAGWNVSRVALSAQGTSFTLSKAKQKLELSSGLLGAHQIGPISAAAVLALELGVSKSAVMEAVAKTTPYEHRMQPYLLAGATIIDDTYNGNLEGIRAGTKLLKELPAKRKIYVTPGLVDQGAETASIHREVGRLIAAARPNLVVLMKNSTTADIQTGLDAAGYDGEVRVENEPLHFYQNLDQLVAVGDVVMMQNDWTDNYH